MSEPGERDAQAPVARREVPLSYRASSDRSLFYALLALLVWVPLPLGSNRPWAVAVLEIWVFGLLALWILWARRGRVAPSGALRKARWVAWLFAAWLAYGLFQILPLPMSVLDVLSPAAAEHWLATRTLLAPADPPAWVAPASLSLEPQASLAAWRLGLALIGVWLLVLLLVRSRRRLRLLALTLVAAAVAQAMLASLLALTGEGLWFMDASSRAHGTYANQNHLAGYLEMSLSLGVGLLVADLAEGGRRKSWRQRLRGWVETLLGPKVRVRIALAIMVVTLVLTGSRMGNTAFFASLLVAGVLGVVAYRRSPRSVLVLLVSLVIVDLLILGSWFGLDRVRERLERTVLTEEARWHLDVRATGYLDDFPLFGSGAGSFYAVFPAYRERIAVPLHFAHADNDILEFQLEYGALGAGLLALVAAVSLVVCVRVLWRRGDPLLRGMALGAAMGMVAIALHSTADANLHIPANAALFMVLLALPWLGLTLGRDRD